MSARALACLAVVLACGCEATSSTEVGVRTSLFGIFEKRGAQEVYPAGGIYLVMPIVNRWHTLPISQQNLLMNASSNEGDRPVPDDITFKTKDGNNVYIDVNVMWRIDPTKVTTIVTRVGDSVDEIRERIVRPMSRSVIRDVFNEITSEEYYQVSVKNRMAGQARDLLAKELSPFGVLVDMLQIQQHRFDQEYQAAINAQKQAEADVQTLIEQQKNVEVQKRSELQAKRAEWNRLMEDAIGEAGKIRNEADAYYQTKINEAKAIVAQAQAESESTRKEADALNKLGGDAYVKMQLAKQFAEKKVVIVPAASVSSMNVNKMVDYLLGQDKSEAPSAPPAKE
jgi:regulator of protease activity HflC (stomatin/prohibitin superfamily)